MYICIMENKEIPQEKKELTQEEMIALKAAEEKQMTAYFKARTPILGIQRKYQEHVAAIWKARYEELHYRAQFIALDARLNSASQEEETKAESKDSN